ncbi:MAG TPA: response regulator [Candidatus Mediterraneibacter cottocaccae]|nr:response regulator [Candidatus Mediterraneibacter cottocaccae]
MPRSAIIIDDEKWVIRSLTATIANQDYFEIVGEFCDSSTAYSYIREHHPDLAFIDVQMPGRNGLELLQAAKEEHLPTLFIVISGHAEFAYAQKAMFNNAVSYCLKPFSRSELMESMQKAWNILERREQRSGRDQDEKQESPASYITYPGINEDFRPPEQLETANAIVRNMLKYLSGHYKEDISIQTLSEYCSITPNYASQLFKKETSFTFSNYLTTLRIWHACRLLCQTDMQIFMIANEVGYKDYFYFAKVFKSSTGYTPSAYRNHFYSFASEKGEMHNEFQNND